MSDMQNDEPSETANGDLEIWMIEVWTMDDHNTFSIDHQDTGYLTREAAQAAADKLNAADIAMARAAHATLIAADAAQFELKVREHAALVAAGLRSGEYPGRPVVRGEFKPGLPTRRVRDWPITIAAAG